MLYKRDKHGKKISIVYIPTRYEIEDFNGVATVKQRYACISTFDEKLSKKYKVDPGFHPLGLSQKACKTVNLTIILDYLQKFSHKEHINFLPDLEILFMVCNDPHAYVLDDDGYKSVAYTHLKEIIDEKTR